MLGYWLFLPLCWAGLFWLRRRQSTAPATPGIALQPE
jgi:hypothetical protein